MAVGEILYQAQAGYSFSYNPSPLTLGAIAYLILFLPVVWFGRWVEGAVRMETLSHDALATSSTCRSCARRRRTCCAGWA